MLHQHHHHHPHRYLIGLGFDESYDGVLTYVMNLGAGFQVLSHHWKDLQWTKIQER